MPLALGVTMVLSLDLICGTRTPSSWRSSHHSPRQPMRFPRPHGQNSLQRIIGGYIVAPHSSKYLVSLKRKTGFHFCGGSLVSRSWVLTAAHCKTEINQMMIVAGEYSLSTFEGTEQIFRPSRMVVHPDYSSTSKNADIMLIKQGAVVREGRFCQVSGWGYTTPMGGMTSDTLRSLRLPIISSGKCNSTASYAGHITKNMICAGFNTGGKDACQSAVAPYRRTDILERKLPLRRMHLTKWVFTHDSLRSNKSVRL
ncbi:Trypsin-3 [Chelonia mydas]|uniref:Trypsin-3 n=1 Tax=Chelonia mydas TaxID=8469 RepID=M7B853_CHEMY|nr:Trypsin-3 [Chelonia mydas]